MISLLLNWKTTLAGIGGMLGALSHATIALSHGDTSTLATDVPVIITSIGLLFAHDAAK